MRQKSGAMLCPSCRKLISVDEKRCPLCGALRPGLWGWGPALQRLLGSEREIVSILVGGCIVLYVLALVLDLPGALQSRGSILSFLAPSLGALDRLGMSGSVAWRHGDWWRLFTAVYLHGSLLHIFFNMMWIRQLGAEAQEAFGSERFFVLFGLSGAGGALCSTLAHVQFSVGASGAIFGLLGGMVAYGRRRGGSWGNMLSRQMLQWAIILFLMGLFMRFVDNWAHLGGFITGFGLGRVFATPQTARANSRIRLLAFGLLAVTLLGFVLCLTQASTPLDSVR